MDTDPGPVKIVQMPGLIMILIEEDTTFRQIFHRWPQASRRSAAVVAGLFSGPMGRRYPWSSTRAGAQQQDLAGRGGDDISIANGFAA